MCFLTEGLSGESEGKGLGRPTSLRAVNWIRMKFLQTSQDRLCCVQTLPVPPWIRLHEDIEPPFAELTFPWLQHRTHGMKPWKKKWQPCISTLDYYFSHKINAPHFLERLWSEYSFGTKRKELRKYEEIARCGGVHLQLLYPGGWSGRVTSPLSS